MKKFASLVTSLVVSTFIFAQTVSVVTITTTGNRNRQVMVDSKTYAVTTTNTTTEQTITINDLMPGQHTLELVRNRQNSTSNSSKSSFTVREGYDLAIKIAANGSINSSETRSEGWTSGSGNGKLSTAAYTKFYTQMKAKTSSTTRAAFFETQLAANKKQLTSQQATQLIQLVSTESLRLKLAKLVYPRVSDNQSFSTVTYLLNSTASRTELNNYIASLDVATDPNPGNTGTNLPPTEVNFQLIYNEVMAEPTTNERAYYLNNYFGRDFNYYTASQAKRLIELVSGEQERLTVAKAAYRGVTDKENYNTVSALLNSTVSRTELRNYINTFDGNNPRSAMTTAVFDRLYQTAYAQNSSTARYTTINNAFSTSGNYFTIAQAKKIIPLVSTEASRLALTKNVYKVLVNRSEYTQLYDVLSFASRADLNSYVNNYENSSGSTGVAMNETDYNALYKSVTNSWTSTSKVNIVSEAFWTSTNHFSTSQVRQLLLLVNSESDRLNLAKNAYDNVVDLSNFSQLYDVFTSTANRNDITNFVANMQSGGSTVVRTPMTDTEFKSTTRSLQLTFGLGAKYAALTEMFNTGTNYFTVAQTKELIQMVSSESNRLELAKLSYDNVTDLGNFPQLYDLLASQSSKTELQTYVSKQTTN